MTSMCQEIKKKKFPIKTVFDTLLSLVSYILYNFVFVHR